MGLRPGPEYFFVNEGRERSSLLRSWKFEAAGVKLSSISLSGSWTLRPPSKPEYEISKYPSDLIATATLPLSIYVVSGQNGRRRYVRHALIPRQSQVRVRRSNQIQPAHPPRAHHRRTVAARGNTRDDSPDHRRAVLQAGAHRLRRNRTRGVSRQSYAIRDVLDARLSRYHGTGSRSSSRFADDRPARALLDYPASGQVSARQRHG